jgi:hypothetical protein
MSQQKQINVDLTKIKNARCTCGNMFFEKTYVIKIIPGLMTGQTQPTMAPVEIYRCNAPGCLIVLPDFLNAIKEPKEDPTAIKIVH